MQLVQTFQLEDAALREIGHDDDRQDDLIGRKAKQESGQDYPVKSEQAGEGIEKSGAVCQQALAAYGHVGQQPEQQPRRGCNCSGPAEDEEGPVENGTDDHPADLGPPVRRKLKGKGGGNPLENRYREQLRHREGGKDSEQDKSGQHQCRKQGSKGSARGAGKEDADHCDQHGESSVAGHEIVGDHRNQPFARGINNPAADNAGGVAAEAHAHSQRLLAAGTAFFERLVEVVGDAGEVARILQQREEGEENCHWRQHNRYHPGQNAVGSQHQHSMQPVGRADPEEKSGQVILKPEEEIGQKLRGDVGAGDGQPKNERQQKQHDRISGPAAGQNAINPAVEGIVAVSLTGDGIEAEVLGGQHQAGNDFVLDVGVGDALNGKGVSGAQHRRGDF